MKKRFSLIAVLLFSFSLCNAGNIVENGDFEGKMLGRVLAKSGTFKLSGGTDGKSGRFAKIEILQLEKGAHGKRTSIALFIGGNRGIPGFPVTPDTEYKFSLMLKGNQPKTIVKVEEIEAEVNELWKAKRKRLKVNFTSPVAVQDGKWSKVEGTFHTSKNGKRASIIVAFWWDERYGKIMYKEGDYVQVDNVVVEKAPDRLAAFSAGKTALPKPAVSQKKVVQVPTLSAVPKMDGKLDDQCWQKLPAQTGFTRLGSKQPANAGSEFKIFRNGKYLYLGVKCLEPAMTTLNTSITGNGTGIWKSDVVEVFIGPALESSFMQFAVGPGGGRYTGDGIKEMTSLYGQWEAKIHRDKNFWSLELKIPWNLMWTHIIENSLKPHLNVCRQRKQNRELSCWTPMTSSFHALSEYGRMFFGDSGKWTTDQLAALKKEIDRLPPAAGTGLKSSLKKMNSLKLGDFYNQLISIKEQIKFAKLADRKFVVTRPAAHRAPTIPLLPEQLAAPPAKLKFSAAVNEACSFPLAITNLTNRAAEYQVLLCSEKINRADEKPGLKNDRTRFSADKIKCLRAIRIKETDEAGTTVRFDPLVEIDKSQVVTAPAKDSALVYYKFDCRDVEPGIYKGFLHVIPLSEPSLSPGKISKLPQIQSIPVEFTVLPIKLSSQLRTPFLYFGNARDKKLVRQMLDEGITSFPVSSWGIRAEFDKDGNVVSKNYELILKNLADQRKWAEEYCPGIKIKHMVIYSMYHIFMNRFGKNKFKVGSAAWKNGFKNWVRIIDEVRKKAGIAPKDFIVEVEDEPAHSKHSAPLPIILEACKMTREAAPEMVTMLTLSSVLEAKDLYQFIPYIDVWNFWEGLLSKKGFTELVSKLRKTDRKIWIYRCNTGINSDLYSYYRLHAWRGEFRKVDRISLWVAYSAPSGYPNGWRNASNGNYMMLFGTPFSTVRNECFLTGFNDLKYYDKLEKVAKQAKKDGTHPALIKQAEQLLKETPEKIINNHNNFRLAKEFRKKAADLILQLQK